MAKLMLVMNTLALMLLAPKLAVTVRASTTRKISPRRRTGTPRASAASGSMDANSSGRYQMAC